MKKKEDSPAKLAKSNTMVMKQPKFKATKVSKLDDIDRDEQQSESNGIKIDPN